MESWLSEDFHRSGGKGLEAKLRDLYAKFALGDIAGFLDGCSYAVTFVVPGKAAESGSFTKATFSDLLARVMERSSGTFREDTTMCAVP